MLSMCISVIKQGKVPRDYINDVVIITAVTHACIGIIVTYIHPNYMLWSGRWGEGFHGEAFSIRAGGGWWWCRSGVAWGDFWCSWWFNCVAPW